MYSFNIYNSNEILYDNLKKEVENKLKKNENDFIIILPSRNIINRLRNELVEKFEAILDLKIFTFDDLINYKNSNFEQLDNLDYYNKLIMEYSIQNCIKKELIEDNIFFNSSGFLSISTKLINYIKSSVISPREFKERINCNSPFFSIGEIYEEYTKNLEKFNLQDRYDRYNIFLNGENSYLNNISKVIISGFLDFRKIEYRVIEYLKNYIEDIIINYMNSQENESLIFTETKNRLLELNFSLNDKKIKIDKIKEYKIVEAEDRYLEVKKLAIDIKKNFDENSKVAIIINDDKYRNLVLSRFKEENIEILSNTKITMINTDFGKFLNSILTREIELKDYIIKNLKNPLIFEEDINDIQLENLITVLNPTDFNNIFKSYKFRSNVNYNEYYIYINEINKMYAISEKIKLLNFIKEKLEIFINKEDDFERIYIKFYKFIESLSFKYVEIIEGLEYSSFVEIIKSILMQFSEGEEKLVNSTIELIDFNNYKMLDHNNIYFIGFSDIIYPKNETVDFYFKNSNTKYLKDIGVDILDKYTKKSKDEMNFLNIIASGDRKYYFSFESNDNEMISDFIYNITDDFSNVEEYGFKNIIKPIPENVINEYDKSIYLSQFEKIDILDNKKNEYPDIFENKKIEITDNYSLTNLEDYLMCPSRYYFKTVLGLHDKFIDEKNIRSLKIGTACHETLEIVYKDYFDEIDNRIFKEKLEKILRKEFENVDFETNDFDGDKVLKRYTGILQKTIEKDLIYLNRKTNNLLPFEFEKKISFKQNIEVNGINKNINIFGRIDRVDKDEFGNLYLVDYKLGKSSIKKFKDFENGKTLQFPVYSLVKNVKGARYVCIKDSSIHEFYNVGNDNINNLSEEEFNNFKLKTLTIIEKIIEQIENENYFLGTEDKSNCTFCDYRDICEYRG